MRLQVRPLALFGQDPLDATLDGAASAISVNRVLGYAAVSSPASSPRGCTIGTGRVRCPSPFWDAADRARSITSRSSWAKRP